MKITPPADENERQLFQVRLSRALHETVGGKWRVDVLRGRYGWYARAVRLRKHRKPPAARPRSVQ